jgi:GNAT superfamily N-acetyltransferase
VGLLSNLLRFNHGPHDDAGATTVRPAQPEEAVAALRLILAPPGQYADDHAASEFITFARDRGIVFDGLHLAERAGKIVSAVLPVVSPGRTMLMLCPHGGAKAVDAATRLVIDPVCRWCADRDVQLAQALIDPHDDALAAVFAAEGFSKMAELHYLHVSAAPNAPFPPLPEGLTWTTYSAADHDLFGRTILASYQQSLDCPALNGRRDVEDILEGHKASGHFDPALWFLLREGDAPLGVLLLSESLRSDGIELVYLGLTPSARGRRLGEFMMRYAVATVAARGQARLCLAVDSLNVPALKLYYRNGMQRVGSKLALLRDLRPPHAPA